MHVRALPLTRRIAHSIVPTGVPPQNLSELGSCQLRPPPCFPHFSGRVSILVMLAR